MLPPEPQTTDCCCRNYGKDNNGLEHFVRFFRVCVHCSPHSVNRSPFSKSSPLGSDCQIRAVGFTNPMGAEGRGRFFFCPLSLKHPGRGCKPHPARAPSGNKSSLARLGLSNPSRRIYQSDGSRRRATKHCETLTFFQKRFYCP